MQDMLHLVKINIASQADLDPSPFRNGRETGVRTDRKTYRHFRNYNIIIVEFNTHSLNLYPGSDKL